MALVREYAQSNSEQAFATLVSQHLNLVYSVALRQVHDPNLAEEITQAVFIILARKAKSLSPKTILSGWLCRTARYVSDRALRTERRRQFREQESRTPDIGISISRILAVFLLNSSWCGVRTQTCPLFWTPGILARYGGPAKRRSISRYSQPGMSACHQRALSAEKSGRPPCRCRFGNGPGTVCVERPYG